MKVIIGSSVILFAMLAAFVAQRIHSVNVRQAEREVRCPLSDLDSYVGSMMNSPHDHETVFLNLSGIGKDEIPYPQTNRRRRVDAIPCVRNQFVG